ncbi:FMP25 Found in Mitochondrial Proteome [Fusarium albosuccineum]|uniref:FMP25 Found in Mitochondrial Proteome n=1 Tax=Fusarium albosuccineum TaxID=1237068 RepID=A0A8H4LBG9_9HYPO|nr:FMP25 Found in Mitochondrial Proteome [Fusarium albosuccineum]
MNASRAALRRAAVRSQGCQPITATQRQWARHVSDYHQAPRRRGGKLVGFVAIFGTAAAGVYFYPKLKEQFASPAESEAKTIPTKAEVEFEKPRKKATSKEENRDLISSQHLQVKHSWEHPGVYAWGSNIGKVIDPKSNDKYVKLPRRIAYFDDQVLRDLKLTSAFGAAVTEKGDLIQWGLGYNKEDPSPVPTLTGKDIVKIDVSLDRIIALSRKGNVYSIPSSRDDQEGGLKEEQQKSSWSLWGSGGGKESINFRNLTPSSLSHGEAVTDISSGQEHCLMLTSKGRVFSAASSALEFPSKGQMGIAGLSWANRPKGPYDQPYEVATLKGFDVAQIAAGDYHSVILDKTGRVFTFGDNAFGQLGFDTDYGLALSDTPVMMATNTIYGNTGLVPTVTAIAAGGNNTYFTVDAKAATKLGESTALAPAKRLPPVAADLWACGQGVYGTLGTGRWSHVSAKPTKVKGLSSLFEFDEKTNKMSPIRLKSLSVGATHCSATMDNVTEVSVSGSASENATNWGADVLFWGGNEHYQLGTGKRTNLNAPAYISALDSTPEARRENSPDFHRLCVTPRTTIRLDGGKGRKVSLEQKVECGKYVTGVYSSV